ncbi:MAG TPA: FAD binding domain-containing protein [Candidatus Binatia bacterium]|nr:FAD binding domain-containing protein [Candidatus Binatia bacterium]
MTLEPPVASPRTLAEAYSLLESSSAEAQLRPVAGSTDLLVQITGELAPPPIACLDLWRLDELRGIAVKPAALVLGALTTFAEIRHSALCRELAPALAEAAATVGAAQIQNRATIGGNIANASPAGDSLPVLLAMDAVIEIGGPRGERSVPAVAMWPAYRTTALAPDELILRIRLPLVPGREACFRKVGTRRAQAISKVVLCLSWRDEPDATALGPRVWRDVRLALGSVAPTPIRATATERVLEGLRPTPETADRAAEALAREIAPIDDIRSTADYRRAVAARVLHRLIREAGDW